MKRLTDTRLVNKPFIPEYIDQIRSDKDRGEIIAIISKLYLSENLEEELGLSLEEFKKFVSLIRSKLVNKIYVGMYKTNIEYNKNMLPRGHLTQEELDLCRKVYYEK